MAAAYRDKARERFHEGKFDRAVADYDQAIKLDKKKKLAGIGTERERAIYELVLAQLAQAWAKIDRGEFEDAHDILMALDGADSFGNRKLQFQVVKALGDIAAVRMEEAQKLAARHHYLPATDLADFLVKALPADHSLHYRAAAIKKTGVLTHTLMMARMRGKPGSVAFHHLMTQALGGERDLAGAAAARAVKLAGGSSADHNQKARTLVVAKDVDKVFQAENEFILGRATSSSNEWDSGGVKYFKVQWGIPDLDTLEALWAGNTMPSAFKLPQAAELPDADHVSIDGGGDDDDDDDPDDGKLGRVVRLRSLGIWYGMGTQMLDDQNPAGEIGADIIIPRKSYTHYPSAYLESSSLGGKVSGWGVQWQLLKYFGKVTVGAGVGYWEREQSEELSLDVPVVRARSLNVPISLRYPLFDRVSVGADIEANYYHLAESEKDDYLHFSTATGRIFTPVPFLSEVSRAFASLRFEGFAGYADGAPNDFYYGGRLRYHRAMRGGGGGDIYKRIKKSTFAVQTMFGPTIDLSFSVGSTILDNENQVRGMGFLLRIPSDKKGKTILEPSLWFESAKLGGGVGGWGIQWAGLFPFAKFGVFGYGLGYMANSQSDVEDGVIKLKQRSLYLPVIVRVPLATSLIVGAEWRANLLQLGGTGEPGDDQAYSPLIGRLWTPVPMLSSMGGVFKKLHIEAHITYARDAPRETVFGGMLVYRPILETKM